MPCRRVISDPDETHKIQSRQWVSFYAADSKAHNDNLDTEYVALSRDVAPDQTGDTKVYRDIGKSVQGVDWVIVPMADVPRLQDEEWELWFAPKPAFEPEKGYNDLRRVEKPVDVTSTGQPAQDSARFLDRGTSSLPPI